MKSFTEKVYYQGMLNLNNLKGHHYREDRKGNLTLRVNIDTYADGYCTIKVARTKEFVTAIDVHNCSLSRPKRRRFKGQLILNRMNLDVENLEINVCAYSEKNPKSDLDLYITEVSPGIHKNTIIGYGETLNTTNKELSKWLNR